MIMRFLLKNGILDYFILLVVLCLNSCQDPVMEVTSVSLSRDSLELTEGESMQIHVTVMPKDATDNLVT